jgi:hypothetical protein
MQLGRKVVLGAVGGEEHRVLGNSMKLKKKKKKGKPLPAFSGLAALLFRH